jgi:excinuclease ABC subunit A
VQTAYFEGEGVCIVEVMGKETRTFSDKFELDGIVFEEPSINHSASIIPTEHAAAAKDLGKF